MEIRRAISLAEFINKQSGRFAAKVLDFSDQGWVLVRDTQDDQYLEPVADAAEHVRRARQGGLMLDVSYQDMLAAWVAEND